jgi:hypothetical protein
MNLNVINKNSSPEWYTPPHILQALGDFDLDPCFPVKPIYQTAKQTYNIHDDGLSKEWFGRVWMNPPYGKALIDWVRKLADHGNGMALTFARTETKVFQSFVFPVASSILFLKGRISFLNERGELGMNSGAPSVLIAYNEFNSQMLAESGLDGKHLWLQERLFIVGYDKTWKLIVYAAIVRESSLEEIYDRVERMAPSRVRRNIHWKAKVRQTVQMHFTRTKPATYTV